MTLPANLADHIRSYLSGPDVDLQTVSAKQIRKQLASVIPDLDIKALRSEIDEISIPIFHEIKESAEAAARKPSPPLVETKPSSSFPALALPSRGIPGVVQSTSSQVGQVQESRSAEGTPRTSQRSGKPTGSKTKKRKSAAYVDTDEEDEEGAERNGRVQKRKSPKKARADGEKTPKRPRAEGEGPGSNKGIHKELNCSAPLAEFLGLSTCSRPQVVKRLWDHIKANGLQDPKDKRQILCDDVLKKIFNTNSVHMFTMNKLLGDHLYKEEEVIKS